MSAKGVFVVAAAGLVLGAGFIACSSPDDRPPATSSGGTGSSSGAGSSSSSSSGSTGDGSTSSDGSSSGGDSGFIETGFRATIAGTPAVYDTTPKAVRQLSGSVVEMSGKDPSGNELRVTVTVSSGLVAAGVYNCAGGAGSSYATIAYATTGGAETWNAQATGECTVVVQSIDNQLNGVMVGTFSGTAKRDGGADKAITSGEFRLMLD